MELSSQIGPQADLWIEKHLGDLKTTIERDLAMNFKKLLSDSPLEAQDRLLNVLAVARCLEFSSLQEWSKALLIESGCSAEAVLEAQQSAAIMGMLNTYYKFKTYLADEAKELYTRAGLRMQSLMKPVNGKEKFEMMAFSVSVVNGCPSCVASHERALVQLGVDVEKVHDLARLASVIKGLSTLRP